MNALGIAIAFVCLTGAPAAPVSPTTSPWSVLNDHLTRGDLVAARAFAETVANERGLHGQMESPLEVGLILDMLPKLKPDRVVPVLDVAAVLSPNDLRLPAARMLTGELIGALTEVLPRTMAALWRDPEARRELLARGAMALWLALATTLIVILAAILLTRGRLLAHDAGTRLPPRLRTSGLPLALAVTAILLPGGLGLGLVGSAILGITLHAFHLRLSERLVCLGLIAGVLGAGSLVTWGLAPVTVADDASRCLAGGCDPASELRLHTASRNDPDFARGRVALALLSLREEPPNLAKAELYLAAVPRGDTNRLVGEVQLTLHRLRDRCSVYGGKAPPDTDEKLAALERALVSAGEPVALLAAATLAGLRGESDHAAGLRGRALAADPHRVGLYLSRLPSLRPGRGDDAPATGICAPLFRPQVEVPVFGLPTLSAHRAPPAWFRLSGADRPGPLQVLAWLALVGLSIPIGWRRSVAFACEVCGTPASVKRNPELRGLTECERCLFARVVVATPNRDLSGAPRDEHRHSPWQLATLVVPGLGAILVGRMATGALGLLLFLVGVFLQPWSAGPSAVDDGGSFSVAAVLARVGLVLALGVWALLIVLELRRPPRRSVSGVDRTSP